MIAARPMFPCRSSSSGRQAWTVAALLVCLSGCAGPGGEEDNVAAAADTAVVADVGADSAGAITHDVTGHDAVACIDGDPCDDGSPCTANDRCEAGACKPGTWICECKADADCLAFEDGDLCNGTALSRTPTGWLVLGRAKETNGGWTPIVGHVSPWGHQGCNTVGKCLDLDGSLWASCVAKCGSKVPDCDPKLGCVCK